MDQVWAIVLAIVPSIGVGFLFYKIIKAIVEGDRNERLAHSRWEAERQRASTADDGGEARGCRKGRPAHVSRDSDAG